MRKNISILVGSGFSIPEGIPGVLQLNQRLSKIDASEISIYADQRALFLKEHDKPNHGSRWEERIFLQEFLEFYNAEVLKTSEKFHYETFYDYYSNYLVNHVNKTAIEGFYNRFNNRYFKSSGNQRDCYNRVSDFNRSFNQLLASQLHKTKYFEDISTIYHPPYDPFIGFLRELIKTSNIKFHTLNHDMFFDWLGQNHTDLWQHFTDGYQLQGSPFYGTVSYDFKNGTEKEVHKTYYVKLARFVDKFDKPLALFKLHGSIFNTIVYTQQPYQQKIRIKDNYAVSDFFMEIENSETGEHKFERLWDEVAPDFLSGTTNKTRFYTGDPYYKNLFNHFEKNLATSELLVVIGYGFQDSGINEYIEKNFLCRGRHMIVIDPNVPQTNLIKKYKATHLLKSVTQVTYLEYLEQIPEELRAEKH